jgi:hypothetical protein
MGRDGRRLAALVLALIWLGWSSGAVAARGSGSSWNADELNWYGISQRRVNDTRADAELDLLKANGFLWGLAHERARDMIARDYFGPTTPEGLDAGAYMRKDGARYERWVEVRAEDTSGQAHDQVAWLVVERILNDQAGRAAVLGDYDQLGVGMAEANGRRVYILLFGKAAPATHVPSAPPLTITEIITAAAHRHAVDAAMLIRVARCESGLNPRAYNPAGPYIGLFQFHPQTFAAYGGTDIFSPHDQSEIAARMFARGLSYHWGCARHG